MKATRFVSTLVPLLLVAAAFLGATPMAAADGKFRILHNFTTGNDGGAPVPFAALAIDKRGNLYGAGLVGGTQLNCPGSDGSGCGVIFKMVRGAGGKWTETVLYNFPNRQNADSPLALDSQGDLYGCTDDGPMFELTPGTGQWTFSAIWSQGCAPAVGALSDGAGDLYGIFGDGKYNDGAISELSPGSSGWAYTDLYDFCPPQGCRDGDTPLAPFSWDAKGNLYGTTFFGGDPHCDCGVTFQLAPNGDGTWTYHLMHRFTHHADGANPHGSLTVDASGNAYSTTPNAGPYTNGNVFKLTPTKDDRWKLSVLYGFPNYKKDGLGPGGNLVLDKAGNLYGMAGSINCNGTCGLIFKLSPQKNGKWNYSVLHNFNMTDGDYPNGLTADSKGNLYGTTSTGGKYGYGVVFELSP